MRAHRRVTIVKRLTACTKVLFIGLTCFWVLGRAFIAMCRWSFRANQSVTRHTTCDDVTLTCIARGGRSGLPETNAFGMLSFKAQFHSFLLRTKPRFLAPSTNADFLALSSCKVSYRCAAEILESSTHTEALGLSAQLRVAR